MTTQAEHMISSSGADRATLEAAWETVTDALERAYGQAVFRSWLAGLHVADVQGDVLRLTAPTRFIREWIQNNYLDTLVALCRDHMAGVKQVEIYIRPKSEEKVAAPEQTVLDFTFRHVEDNLGTPLDPRFTFEQFVVGESNELAYRAAMSIASSKEVVPGCNPLFLYGGVGLGKTHLLQAIAHKIKAEQPSRKVVYLSAERFMFQFIRALRNKDVFAFKEQFRSVDVLLVDDIQFISGKESTLEEFFHTFNTLVDNNRQVVLTCDRSPADLTGMGERARSRLGWGLVADVHAADDDLRRRMLDSKAKQLSFVLPEGVKNLLASKVTSSLRELEGALNKLVLHSNLMQLPVTTESTKKILSDLFKTCDRNVTVEEIQKKVAMYFGITMQDIMSARRARNVARPRQVAMYLAKHYTVKSLAEIGQRFSNRDHTTVMHAVKKVEELKKTDAEIANAMVALETMFG
jgi:chromosomal replication initiator protein